LSFRCWLAFDFPHAGVCGFVSFYFVGPSVGVKFLPDAMHFGVLDPVGEHVLAGPLILFLGVDANFCLRALRSPASRSEGTRPGFSFFHDGF